MSIRLLQLLVSGSLKPCSQVLIGETGPQKKKTDNESGASSRMNVLRGIKGSSGMWSRRRGHPGTHCRPRRKCLDFMVCSLFPLSLAQGAISRWTHVLEYAD